MSSIALRKNLCRFHYKRENLIILRLSGRLEILGPKSIGHELFNQVGTHKDYIKGAVRLS